MRLEIIRLNASLVSTRGLVAELYNALLVFTDADDSLPDLEKIEGFLTCSNCGKIGHTAKTCNGG